MYILFYKVQDSFGCIGAAITLFFIVTQIIPFYNVIKGKLNFEDTPWKFAALSYINCICWYLYGDLLYSFELKYCYFVGAILSCSYLCVYLFFEMKKDAVDTILNALLLISGSYMIYIAFTEMIDNDKIIGIICVGTYLLTFVFPIILIYRVLSQKNYCLINFHRECLSLFESICWVVYGVLFDEVFVVLPHVFKMVLDLTQIIIFLNFKKKYPRIGDKETNSNVVFDSVGNDESKKGDISVNEDETQSNLKEKPVKIIEKI